MTSGFDDPAADLWFDEPCDAAGGIGGGLIAGLAGEAGLPCVDFSCGNFPESASSHGKSVISSFGNVRFGAVMGADGFGLAAPFSSLPTRGRDSQRKH